MTAFDGDWIINSLHISGNVLTGGAMEPFSLEVKDGCNVTIGEIGCGTFIHDAVSHPVDMRHVPEPATLAL